MNRHALPFVVLSWIGMAAVCWCLATNPAPPTIPQRVLVLVPWVSVVAWIWKEPRYVRSEKLVALVMGPLAVCIASLNAAWILATKRPT